MANNRASLSSFHGEALVPCRSGVHAFLSSSGLWAAIFPDLSLFTMYSGSSFEAATLWPLICVGLVCFFTTLPVLRPPDEFQETLSPAFSDFAIASTFRVSGIHRQLRSTDCVLTSMKARAGISVLQHRRGRYFGQRPLNLLVAGESVCIVKLRG